MLNMKRPTIKRMKATLRWSYRVATARGRVLPGLVIIGAQKSGTTSLFHYLSQHPRLFESDVKEVHYFDGGLQSDVDNYAKGANWYRAHFPLQRELRDRAIAFEASPLYLFSPLAPARMARLLPNAKLVAVLRDPVERAISHYFHEKRKGRENLRLFDALRAEESRLSESLRRQDYKSHEFIQFSYKRRGLYYEQLERFRQYYRAEQMLIIDSSDLFTSPSRTLSQVMEFLGLDQDWDVVNLSPANVASNKTPVEEEVRDYLQGYFAPHNRQLLETYGVGSSWQQ